MYVRGVATARTVTMSTRRHWSLELGGVFTEFSDGGSVTRTHDVCEFEWCRKMS